MSKTIRLIICATLLVSILVGTLSSCHIIDNALGIITNQDKDSTTDTDNTQVDENNSGNTEYNDNNITGDNNDNNNTNDNNNGDDDNNDNTGNNDNTDNNGSGTGNNEENITIADLIDIFCPDKNNKPANAEEAIAQAIINLASPENKTCAFYLKKYDCVSYCYYAADEEGNIFFTDKMSEDNKSSVQIGLSNLTGLDKIISDKLLETSNLPSYYRTSDVCTVGTGDVVSITYFESIQGEIIGTFENQEYYVVGSNPNLDYALIGMEVGTTFPYQISFVVDYAEGAKIHHYSNVTVNHIVLDKSPEYIKDGDSVFVSYTFSFDASPWYDAGTNSYRLPDGYNSSNVNENGIYIGVIKNSRQKATTSDGSTLSSYLVGMQIGEKASFTVNNEKIGDTTVSITYTDMTVERLIISDIETPLTVRYTPYDTDFELKSTHGNVVNLKNKELTYFIFPIYVIQIGSFSSLELLQNFSEIMCAKHVVDNETKYVLDILNDAGYVNGDKSVAVLIEELAKISRSYKKDDSIISAESALIIAQKNYAIYDGDSEAEKANLKNKIDAAHEAYNRAFFASETVRAQISDKILEILDCTKEDVSIRDTLVEEFLSYVSYLLSEI